MGFNAFTYSLYEPSLGLGYANPSGTSIVSPPTGAYPVSIAGRNYMVDTNFEPYRREAFRHKSLSPQRQSLHFTNIPDDGTVSTEGLWRREARDWSLGAGQIYFDRKNSSEQRYYRSKGVDTLTTQWQTTLLPATSGRYTSGSAGNTVKAIHSGQYVYIQDGNSVVFTAAWGSTTTVTGFSGTVYDIATDGNVVWILTSNGLYETVISNTDGSAKLFSWTMDADTTGLLTFTGGRLLMAINNAPVIPTSTNIISSGASIFDLSSANRAIGSGQALAKPIGYLNGALNSTATTFNIDYLTDSLANNALIRIEGETIQLTAAAMAGATSLAGTRGRNSTTASAHASGTPIYSVNSTTIFCPNWSGGTAPSRTGSGWIFTHPNLTWKWSGIAAGSSQVYFIGNSGGTSQSGLVYRSTVPANTSPTASLGTLSQPVVALPLPAGEYPTAIRNYLNYIFIGTNKGIRMCQTLNSYDPVGNTGDLKSGPLIPNVTQPVTQPVSGIVGYDRFVYFTWNNYDSSSTGLGRMDLTQFIDTQAPAYASDLMITGQGNITYLDWDPLTNSPLMSYNPGSPTASKVYTADNSQCVASGTIDSGLITYGIPDYKNAVSIDLNWQNYSSATNGQISFNLTTDSFPSKLVGSYSGNQNKQKINFDQSYGEQYRVTTTLTAGTDGSGKNYSPVLNRWTLKSLPGIPSGIMISAVLLMYEPMDMDGQAVYLDPYDEYAFLEELRQAQTVVTYVEGPFTADVTVDMIDWMPERRRNVYQGGYYGDLVVYLKTITG